MSSRHALMALGASVVFVGACHLIGGYDDPEFGAVAQGSGGNAASGGASSVASGGAGQGGAATATGGGGGGGGGAALPTMSCTIEENSARAVARIGDDRRWSRLRMARDGATRMWLFAEASDAARVQALLLDPSQVPATVETCPPSMMGTALLAVRPLKTAIWALVHDDGDNGKLRTATCVSGEENCNVDELSYTLPNQIVEADIAMVSGELHVFYSKRNAFDAPAPEAVITRANLASQILNSATTGNPPSNQLEDYKRPLLTTTTDGLVGFLGDPAAATPAVLRRFTAGLDFSNDSVEPIGQFAGVVALESRNNQHLVVWRDIDGLGYHVGVELLDAASLAAAHSSSPNLNATLPGFTFSAVVAPTEAGVILAEPQSFGLDLAYVDTQGARFTASLPVAWPGGPPSVVALLSQDGFGEEGGVFDLVWADSNTTSPATESDVCTELSAVTTRHVRHARVTCGPMP